MRSRISTSRSRLSLSPVAVVSVGKPPAACRQSASSAPANPSAASLRHVTGRTVLCGIIVSVTVIRGRIVGGGGSLAGRIQKSVKCNQAVQASAPDRCRTIFNGGQNDKGPGIAEAPNATSNDAYLSEVEMLLKFVDSLVPTPWTAVMIAIAMPAAIRPYSIAVAPDSSLTKRETRFFMYITPVYTVAGRTNVWSSGVLSTVTMA